MDQDLVSEVEATQRDAVIAEMERADVIVGMVYGFVAAAKARAVAVVVAGTECVVVDGETAHRPVVAATAHVAAVAVAVAGTEYGVGHVAKQRGAAVEVTEVGVAAEAMERWALAVVKEVAGEVR